MVKLKQQTATATSAAAAAAAAAAEKNMAGQSVSIKGRGVNEVCLTANDYILLAEVT